MSIRSTAMHVDARFEDVLAAAGPVSVGWDDGERRVVQEGVAHEVVAAGPQRCRDVMQHLPTVHHEGPGAPLWMGGLAFDPQHTAAGPWAGFPATRFRLPRRQWLWQGGTCTLTTLGGGDVAPAVPRGLLPTTPLGAWAEGCEAVTQAIRAGRITKAVLARCESRPAVDPMAAFLRLREPGDGTAFWFREGDAVFFGCTPERLVRLHSGALSTHALAGSTHGGSGAEAAGHALQASGKDVLEHELVAAFLRERLVEAGVQGVHQSGRGLRRLRHVQHLETPIQGRADGKHVLDIAHHLHPTPAVCGTPRQRSLRLIRSLEGFPRGWYAGSVGWFDPRGDGELCVALRCALATPDACHLFAGAGIVAGSEADAEWQETEDKLAAVREAL